MDGSRTFHRPLGGADVQAATAQQSASNDGYVASADTNKAKLVSVDVIGGKSPHDSDREQSEWRVGCLKRSTPRSEQTGVA